MALIHVDRQRFELRRTDTNLLHALLSLGFDVPYFCWHPALGSVGACRQCAVKVFKDEADTRGAIVMSCMTPVRDGMFVSVDDPAVREFRRSVIEWLMLGHPHDCPVCDEGGQCHLQDMTVMTGHNYRTSRFPKRTHRNQDLGPFLAHEMNRCIQCYRCVRFYRTYAGGDDLAPLAVRDHVYFGRHASGPLENEFAGNLAEVCPTGVFTDKPARARYARKWDLTMAPSICLHCGLGCNTILAARYDRIVRVENRYHHAVNGYFLCDRGRFARDFLESDARLRVARWRERTAATPHEISTGHAIRRLAAVVNGRVIGIGSPRASLETNFALRELVGPANFWAGLSKNDLRLAEISWRILRDGPARAYSLGEIEQAEAVFILGEDVTNTAPRLALTLRQTARRQPEKDAAALGLPRWQEQSVSEVIQQKRGPFFVASAAATKLDDIATATYRAAPDDIARLGFAVATALDAKAIPVADLTAENRALAESIAVALKASRRVAIIAGSTLGHEPILWAADTVVRALLAAGTEAGLCLLQPEANALGVAMLGGQPLEEAFALVERGEIDAAIIVENDLYRRAPRAIVDRLFANARAVVALDVVRTHTTDGANIALPVASSAESDGTVINNEGRAQRYYRVIPPREDSPDAWRVLAAVASRTWDFDGITAAMAASVAGLAKLAEVAPTADYRLQGARVPLQPPRFSGRAAMHAHERIHEPKPPVDPDSPFVFSMDGGNGIRPAALTGYYWSPGWNSGQALNKFQEEVAGALRGGENGVRFIEPALTFAPRAVEIPPPFTPSANEWLIVPLPHIFGADELSALSPPIAERAWPAFLVLHPDDAARLAAADGEIIEISGPHETLTLPLAIDPSLPEGVAGLCGVPVAAHGLAWPIRARLAKRTNA
jgi:NADH-quinone oxidoreductase subunit G